MLDFQHGGLYFRLNYRTDMGIREKNMQFGERLSSGFVLL